MLGPSQLKPAQKALSSLMVLCLIIYSLANLGLIISAYVKLNTDSQTLHELATNWRNGAIIDIIVAKTCPIGYEPAIKDRYWPGVQNGCWCGAVPAPTLQANNITCNPFCDRVCIVDEGELGCRTVGGWHPQLVNFWGTKGGDLVQICVKRSAEAWSNIGPISPGYCPAGYIKCGTAPEYVFCTRLNECPITKVEISSMNAAQMSTCLANPSNCVVLDDSAASPRMIMIQRSNSYDGLPLSEFRLNEYGMCNYRVQDEVTPGRIAFPLLTKKLPSCFNEGGYKWNQIDSITERKLFALHGLTTYITNLDDFPSSGMSGFYPTGKSGNDFQWKMFTRGFIPWKISCREFMAKTAKRILNGDIIERAQLILMIIGCVCSGVLGIILTFIKIQYIRGVGLPWMLANGEEERRKLDNFEMIVTFGLKILQIPFQIWCIVLMGTTRDLYYDLAARSCTDYDINVAFYDFADRILTTTYRLTIASLSVTVGFLVLQIMFALCYHHKPQNPKDIQRKKKRARVIDSTKKPPSHSRETSASTVLPFTPAKQPKQLLKYDNRVHNLHTMNAINWFPNGYEERTYPRRYEDLVSPINYSPVVNQSYSRSHSPAEFIEDYRIYPRQYPQEENTKDVFL